MNQQTKTSRILDVLYISESVYVQAMVNSKYDGGQGQVDWVFNDEVIRSVKIKDDTYDLDLRLDGSDVLVDISGLSIWCEIVIPRLYTVNLTLLESDLVDLPDLQDFSIPHFNASKFYSDSTYALLESRGFGKKTDSILVVDLDNEIVFSDKIETNGITNLQVIDESILAYGGENLILYLNLESPPITINLSGENIKDVEAGDESYFYILTEDRVYSHAFFEGEYMYRSLEIPSLRALDLEVISTDSSPPTFHVLGEKADGSQVYLQSKETGWSVSENMFHENNQMSSMHDLAGEIIFAGNVVFQEKEGFIGPSLIHRPSLVDYLQDNLSIELLGFTKIADDDDLEFSIKLKNERDQAIENFGIFSSNVFSIMCHQEHIDIHVESLGPSEVITVKDTLVVAEGLAWDTDLCLFVAGHGRVFDPAFHNNLVCGIPVNLSEESEEEGSAPLVLANPVDATLRLRTSQVNPEYVIYDSQRKALKKGRYQEGIDVAALTPGIYIISVLDESRCLSAKFLKL